MDEAIARADEIWKSSIVARPNRATAEIIVASLNNSNNEAVSNYFDYSCTDFNAHTNMVVLGKHYHVINDTGETAEVQPFTPDYSTL